MSDLETEYVLTFYIMPLIWSPHLFWVCHYSIPVSGINVFPVLCCAGLGLNLHVLPRKMGSLRKWAAWSHPGHRLTSALSWEPWYPSRKAAAGQGLGFLLHLSAECVSHNTGLWETNVTGVSKHRFSSRAFEEGFYTLGFIYVFIYSFKLYMLCVFSTFGFLLVFISLLKILLLCRIPSECCIWMLRCSSSVFNIASALTSLIRTVLQQGDALDSFHYSSLHLSAILLGLRDCHLSPQIIYLLCLHEAFRDLGRLCFLKQWGSCMEMECFASFYIFLFDILEMTESLNHGYLTALAFWYKILGLYILWGKKNSAISVWSLFHIH